MMLPKLRRRVIVILMAVFLILIAGVVCCVQAINVQQIAERQKETLRSAALQPMSRRSRTPTRKEYPSRTPFFAVRFNRNGEMTSVYNYDFDISDEEALLAAERAIRHGHTSGVLRELKLRYLVRTDAEGYTRVTFISMAEDEVRQQKQLISSLLLIPVLLVLLFLFVALPLSKWLVKPVQSAWDAQRRFIADASHELKTPLTVILANLSILQKHPQQTIASCEGWLESTQQEAQQMRKLVEEMLMLARTEDDQPAAEFTQTHISELMEQAIMTIEPVAFENGVTLETSIAGDLTAACSEMHIRQLMMILLDNAIKYAGGEKKVSIILTKKQEQIELRVTNTGSPIPAEMLPHLFDRFYRSGANRTSNGFGLGLAIAKQIVEMHRGRIQVTSNAEEGTTFLVLMPCIS